VQSRTLYGLIYLAMFLSLGHHIDHVIRDNNVGWLVRSLLPSCRLSRDEGGL